VGDGSYSTSGFMAMGTGKLGLGMLAASAVGSSVGNARARRRAAEAATPMWRPVDQGGVHVSLHGFYLTDGHHGFRRFGWHHIVQASVVEPGCLHFHATTDEGPADFLLRSDWAELAFVLWALARNPHHPQLLARSWIDPAFPARCQQHGYAPPTLELG
jgi:hypothetical protein